MAEAAFARGAEPLGRVSSQRICGDLPLAADTDAECAVFQSTERAAQFLQTPVAPERQGRIQLMKGGPVSTHPLPGQTDRIVFLQVLIQLAQDGSTKEICVHCHRVLLNS